MAKDSGKISNDETRQAGEGHGAGSLKPSKTMVKGVAFGIGSAAIVAALLYATRNKRKK